MNTLFIQCVENPQFRLFDENLTLFADYPDTLVAVNSLQQGLVRMLKRMPQLVVLHTDSLGRDLNDFIYLAQRDAIRTMVLCGSDEVLFGIMGQGNPNLKIRPVLQDRTMNSILGSANLLSGASLVKSDILHPACFKGMDVFELSHICLEGGGSPRFVQVSDIMRVEFFGSNSRFYLNSGEILLGSKPLDHYISTLRQSYFFNANGIDLVNLNYVNRIGRSEYAAVYMTDGSSVQVCSSAEQELLKLFRTVEIKKLV